MTRRNHYAVIGDLVRSKQASDRRELQIRLRKALTTTNEMIPAANDLEVTLGDEFQGLYSQLEPALAATILLRLLLGPQSLRFGLGVGQLAFYSSSESQLDQDGPAWWAARTAIESTINTSTSSALEMVKSRREMSGGKIRAWEQLTLDLKDISPPLREGSLGSQTSDRLANAALQLSEGALERLDERDCRIAVALIRGDLQTEIARTEKISGASVSGRIARNGIKTIVQTFNVLRQGTA